MWNVKTNVIPVIIGATGTISKIIEKIPEQHAGKARDEGTTENGHVGHCARSVGSTNVKVQKI
jgi:hypothetical protein